MKRRIVKGEENEEKYLFYTFSQSPSSVIELRSEPLPDLATEVLNFIKIFLLSLSSCSCFLKIWVGRGECEESRAVVVTIVEGTRPLYSQVPQVPYKLVGEPNNLFVKVWLGGQIVKWKMAGALYNACGRINRINQIKNATQFVERRRTAALWCIWCITILAHHY